MALLIWDNGGVDALWSTKENWVGDVAPISTDTVQFDVTSIANSTADISVAGISILSTYSGTVTANAAISLGAFSIDAGTFDGGSLALSITSYTQTGGTVTATSDVLTMINDWNKTGGTFNHNNGQLNLETIGSPHQTITNSAVEVFYQLRMSKGAFDMTIATTKVQVSNRFIIDNSNTSSSPQLAGTVELIGTAKVEQNGNLYDGGGSVSFQGTNHEWIQNNANSSANLPAVVINCTDLTLTEGIVGNSFGSWSWTWLAGTITNAATAHFKNNQTSKHNMFNLFQTLTIGQLTTTLNNFDLEINDETGSGPAELAVDGDVSLNGISSGSQLKGVGSTLSIKGNYSQNSSSVNATGEITVLFNGTGDQTINVPNDHTIPCLTVDIDKASGKVTLLDDLDQQRPTNDFLHTNGTLDLSGFNLSSGNDCTLSDTLADLAGSTISAGGDFSATTDLIGSSTWQLNVSGSNIITGGTVTNCDALSLSGNELFAFTSVDGGGNSSVLFENVVIRFLNRASAVGGNGRTNATTGTNRAYNNDGEWEAAEQADLVALGVKHRVKCSGVAADTTENFNIAGWTVDSTHYVTMESNANTVDGRNNSRVYSANHYRMEPAGFQSVLSISSMPFTRLIGLQINGTSGGNGRSVVLFVSSDSCIIDGCKIKYSISGTDWKGIGLQSGTEDICVKNCIIDGSGGIPLVAGIENDSAVGTSRFYNNTIVNCDNGIKNDSAANNVLAKNNLVYNCTTSYTGLFDATSNYNATDNAETTGGANDRQSQTFMFQDAPSDDYGLKKSDEGALNMGVDLSADANCPVVFDNINTSRPQGAAYDIGSFETKINMFRPRSLSGLGCFGLRYGLRCKQVTQVNN